MLGLTSCETSGRLGDLLPKGFYRLYDSNSDFPNINEVPQSREASGVALEEDGDWQERLEEHRSRLEEREVPQKKNYLEPWWPIDEKI